LMTPHFEMAKSLWQAGDFVGADEELQYVLTSRQDTPAAERLRHRAHRLHTILSQELPASLERVKALEEK